MSCRLRHSLLVTLLLAVCGSKAMALDASNVLVVDLYLNEQPMGESFVLQYGPDFYVDESVLLEWQVSRPWPAPEEFLGRRYYNLAKLSGTSAKLNQRLMALHVSVPTSLLPSRVIDLFGEDPRALKSDFGAYVDYDLNWISQEFYGTEETYALARPVVFGSFGNVTANLGYRNISSENPGLGSNGGSSFNLLDLTYTRDDPDNLRSIRVGDIFATPGTQGRAVRMGGIQIGTNFGTRPTFITYPLPSFYGQSAVPSAVDLYVNGRLTRRQQVQPGSYELENLPVVNGAGQLQVVATDALGRQQVFTQDFYLATEMLKEGLHDYSVSVGAIRENYGLENLDYGDLAASANWRFGYRDNLTLEGHTEFSPDVAMLGGSAQYKIGSGGTLTAGAGISSADPGTGSIWQLGFRQITGGIGYNVAFSGASENFRLIGSNLPLPKLQAVASASRGFYNVGTLALSAVHQNHHQLADRTVISANFSRTFRNTLSLSAFVSYASSIESDTSVGLRFSMQFGDDHSTTGSISNSAFGSSAEAYIQRHLPYGTGYGYRLGGNNSNNSFVDAGFIAQNDYGTYSIDYRDSEFGGAAWQAGSSGSIAILGGTTNFTRQVRDAFAIVNVGGIEGVRVYAENLEIGRTDENGQLFVPGLRPFLKNRLSIEIDDLPMNASVGAIKTEASPYDRSGIVVNFDVRIANNIMLTAKLPDGSAVPEGAKVYVRPSSKSAPVGLEGQVYLQGVDRSSLVEIRWRGLSCELDIPFPSESAVISQVGDILCDPKPIN